MSGIEAAIHLIKTMFANDSTEGMLLVDATSTFNSLNSNVALHIIWNIYNVCVLLSLHCLLTHITISPFPYTLMGILSILMNSSG